MLNVSRETLGQYAENPAQFLEWLGIYEALIRKWNPKINLVSPKTIDELWERHFLDSAQLLEFVPREILTALDIGSGGGFPALVLAAARPEILWTLVESDQRKCVFLRTAAREMGLTLEVRNERIEALGPSEFDLITARALADLNQLFEWSFTHAQQGTFFLFPKGKSWQSELTRATENWQMEAEDFPSQTDENARILRITKLERR